MGCPYDRAKPLPGRRDMLVQLKAEGHRIIIHTARKMQTYQGNVGLVIKDVGLITLQQLQEWDFPYDEIYFGKPSADRYVDDKSYSIDDLL